MKTIDLKQQYLLKSIFYSRRNFYYFLYILFSEPDENEYLLEISKTANLNDLVEVSEGGKILNEFFRSITKDQISEEREQYKQLFLGPGPIKAPLWESYYLSKEHLLFDESTFQVRQFYHRHGIQYRKENKEPDDHLLLEIEFMIFLIDSCLKDNDNIHLNSGINDQTNFLSAHILAWVPHFVPLVVEHSKSKLYQGAALLLFDFLTADLEILDELREEIDHG